MHRHRCWLGPPTANHSLYSTPAIENNGCGYEWPQMVKSGRGVVGEISGRSTCTAAASHFVISPDTPIKVASPTGAAGERSWTVEEDRLLGTLPDGILARRWERTLYAVKTRRQLNSRKPKPPRPWTADEERRLGTTSDAEVARLFRRDELDVRSRRRHLGIPVFDSNTPRSKNGRKTKLDYWERLRTGKRPDSWDDPITERFP